MPLTDKGEARTQGTHLYFVDPTGTPALVKLTCPTGITGLTGGAADQIEDTCLDETDTRTYVRGLNTPAAMSVPFNLHPQDASHQLLFALKESGETVKWMALLSEADTPPTLAAGPVPPAGSIEPPVDRTGFDFEGYISEVALDIATNQIVRGTLTIQRTGGVTPHWVA
jgi:hypothetical protein